MNDSSRFGASIGFLDFLFNIVLTFMVIAVLLLFITRIEASKPSVETKNELIITVQWNDGTDDDIDLWIQDPGGKTIGFLNKEEPGMHLQRDDTGRANKRIIQTDGSEVEIPTNNEVVNISTLVPGQYNVNLHLFRADSSLPKGTPLHATVKLVRINPYQEIGPFMIEFDRAKEGSEVTVLNFKAGVQGEPLVISHLPVSFVSERIRAAKQTSGN